MISISRSSSLQAIPLYDSQKTLENGRVLQTSSSSLWQSNDCLLHRTAVKNRDESTIKRKGGGMYVHLFQRDGRKVSTIVRCL